MDGRKQFFGHKKHRKIMILPPLPSFIRTSNFTYMCMCMYVAPLLATVLDLYPKHPKCQSKGLPTCYMYIIHKKAIFEPYSNSAWSISMSDERLYLYSYFGHNYDQYEPFICTKKRKMFDVLHIKGVL